VLEAKYGRTLQALFKRPGGEALRQRINEMSNEEYQALIRLPGQHIRESLLKGAGVNRPPLSEVLSDISDDQLPLVLSNLGGHDLEELLTVLSQIDAEQERPTILFAYTIKGWGLPIAGHPLNHSMLLSESRWLICAKPFESPPMMNGPDSIPTHPLDNFATKQRPACSQIRKCPL
jgi:pyruvate dehydrogenase E1 component